MFIYVRESNNCTGIYYIVSKTIRTSYVKFLLLDNAWSYHANPQNIKYFNSKRNAIRQARELFTDLVFLKHSCVSEIFKTKQKVDISNSGLGPIPSTTPFNGFRFEYNQNGHVILSSSSFNINNN